MIRVTRPTPLWLASLLMTLLLSTTPAVASDALYQMINQRLALMQDVAAYKWLEQQPIEVPDREKVVLENAVAAGLNYGITRASSERFFSAQIEAAKEIQQCWFNNWMRSTGPKSAPDLDQITRPRLLALGETITASLAGNVNDPYQFSQAVIVPCLSDDTRNAIFEALQAIAVYPDRYTQIKDSGILRVGTTGDYAPFSFSPERWSSPNDRAPEGIDIELASSLAEHLQVNLMLVPTSWPNLMNDLKAGRYDIAMSGVSIIPERQTSAYFSKPYHIGGKSPIARCDRRQQFSSLAAIDQPGVTIMVNPGGTNERFLRSNILKAEILIHGDNREIFEKLAAGEADLMITDLIEAQLQSARNPALCMTMPDETMTYQEKGYMLPKDPSLLAAVNSWLTAAQAAGTLSALFDQHLR